MPRGFVTDGPLSVPDGPEALPTTPMAPAGWYPDPADPTRQLFWDGSAWSGQVRTSGSAASLRESVPSSQTATALLPPVVAPGATAPLAQPQVVYVVQSKTNGLAIASFVLALVPVIPFVGSILACIFSGVARKQIDESEGRERGKGLAMAGGILGVISTIGTIALVVILAIGVSHSNDRQVLTGRARLYGGRRRNGLPSQLLPAPLPASCRSVPSEVDSARAR